MANLNSQALSRADLYSTGFIINFPDGTQLLKRVKYQYKPTATKDITHVVKDHDRIWDIAFQYYGNDLYWFIIADANDIMNPFELTIGEELVIPDLEKAKLQL